jgi:hypothetical protein
MIFARWRVCRGSVDAGFVEDGAEFYLVAAHVCGDGLDGGAHVLDLGDKSAKCVRFAAVGAVFFGEDTNVRIAVEGGAAKTGTQGGGVECDLLAGQGSSA